MDIPLGAMDNNSDGLLSTPLQPRVQSYRSQVHAASVKGDYVGNIALQSEIMNAAETLHALSSELKSYANTLSPISRLSPEILALVFLFLSYDLPLVWPYKRYSEDYNGYVKTNPLSTWLKVTHISRFWRQVALGDSSLWTEISTSHGPSWADALLKRGEPRALTLTLDKNIVSDEDAVWKRAIARAHTIQIESCGLDFQLHLAKFPAHPVSKLRIHLHGSEIEDPNGSEDKYWDPSDFFPHYFEDLQELEFCGVPSSLYAWPFFENYSALTSLVLGSFDQWACVETNCCDFLKTLSKLQNLQSLTFIGLEDLPAWDNEEDTDKAIDFYADSVTLPHLQIMRLDQCHPNTMICIFNAIVSPPGAKMHLLSHSHWWNTSEFHGGGPSAIKFLDVLKRRLSIPPCDALRTVAVSSTSLPADSEKDRVVRILGWRTDVDPQDLLRVCNQTRAPSQEPDFEFRVLYDPDEVECEAYPSKLVRIFNRASIRTLLSFR